MSDALDRIRYIKTMIKAQEQLKKNTILAAGANIETLKVRLDEAIVGAVDWAEETTAAAAQAAGYKAHTSVFDARERIAKRRVKVR